MSEHLDRSLDGLRASNPVSADELRAELDDDGLRLARERAMAAGRAAPDAEPVPSSRRRSLLVLAAVAVVAAVAVGVALILSGGSGDAATDADVDAATDVGEAVRSSRPSYSNHWGT